MRQLIVLILISVLLAPPGLAHETGKKRQDEKAKCEQTKQEIRRIQSRMRQGYSARQGEKMQQQLRELRLQRAKVCR